MDSAMKNGPGVNSSQGPQRPLCVVSACLCGVTCRYDGRDYTQEELAELCRQGMALPVCPEVEGGLGVPRSPCELRAGRVMTRDGVDVTENFHAGAAATLRIALEHGIGLAILKERSPSCGSSLIYDGTFSSRVIKGSGVTAALLKGHGIKVVNESDYVAALKALTD